jgi:hypothetical protein
MRLSHTHTYAYTHTHKQGWRNGSGVSLDFKPQYCQKKKKKKTLQILPNKKMMVNLSIYLYIYLSIYLSIYMSVCLSIYLPTYLSSLSSSNMSWSAFVASSFRIIIPSHHFAKAFTESRILSLNNYVSMNTFLPFLKFGKIMFNLNVLILHAHFPYIHLSFPTTKL